MKNKLLLSLALLLSVSLSWAQPDFSMIGYAAMEGEGIRKVEQPVVKVERL